MTKNEFKRLQIFIKYATEKGINMCSGHVESYQDTTYSSRGIRDTIENLPAKLYTTIDKIIIDETVCGIPRKHVKSVRLWVELSDGVVKYF